ncbi:DUF5819 family protein [Yinghuangia sp. YIM S09857]|uniref:DUF5819 family protein n=1 Tax=Yinghuangia sp. YIM S09857 TaxID=3436929 RepID=UPI003F539730
MPAQETSVAGSGPDADPDAGQAVDPAVGRADGAPPPGKPAVDPEDPGARSPRVQLVAALIAVVLVVGAGFHLLFVGLHVAPDNQASRKYSEDIRGWINPLFEQNWRLFAPDILAVNHRVNARVQYRAADGTVTESDWTDLSGDDIAHIQGNPFPSKADQNLLRRAWDFYMDSHNSDESAADNRADLSEEYLRRIVVKRFQAAGRADGIVAVQVRVVSTAITPPGAAPTQPTVRELGWWETKHDDFR